MVTAITQAKDLNNMDFEKLIGSLGAHEVIFQEVKPTKKGKLVAFKSSQKSSNEDIENIEDLDEEDAKNELALLARKIQRMLKSKEFIRKKFPARKEVSKGDFDKSQVVCYGCNKPGHYKSECPLNKQKKFPQKKESMLATWDDSDHEEPEAEEEANMCLIAESNDDDSDMCLNTEGDN
ncbi:phytoalexin-deficient 4-2 protein, partial [Trifolium medium]|nr:phytoalexin-deficient 4-2 protein [Trifolium medium]